MQRAGIGARLGAGALGVVLAGAAVWHMAVGGPVAVAEPVVVAVATAAPLRQAAGTPVALWKAAVELPPAMPAAADPCAGSLEVFAEEGAMLGLTLQAPCEPNARVELRHAGLVVTMQTMATGSLFASIPAMDAAGEVEARFGGGEVLAGAAAVPELAAMRRFAVEWEGDDRMALNAFENGADYNGAGHRTAANGGVLALGDAGAGPAALAEIYTFPDPAKVRVTIEAEVTDATCGRELRGRTVYSAGGGAKVTDLTLAMPECDALGGFVVLNNPLPDMKLAAAE